MPAGERNEIILYIKIGKFLQGPWQLFKLSFSVQKWLHKYSGVVFQKKCKFDFQKKKRKMQ